ncbi:MAG: methyltransferase domain-containing protein [Patescibacteria group bacterium]
MSNLSGGSELLDAKQLLAKAGVKRGDVVADLGVGGVGHFVFPASTLVDKEGLVYAVDIRRLVLEGVNNHARVDGIKNIKTVWANLEVYKSTGIPNDSADESLLINILFQSPHPDRIINEAVRVLKPSGRLLIIDWGNLSTNFGPIPENRVNKQEIIQLVEKMGLKLVEDFDAGNYHFGLLFTK